jgi:uncharacterized protein (TIGR02246 family)
MKIPHHVIAAGAPALGLCFAIAFTLSCSATGDKAAAAKAAEDAVRQQIAKYTAALDAADANLAAQVWRTSPDISLIHPAGHAHGWEEIKGFYNYFAANFSERKLTARDVSVHVNGDTAWAEFYWHYVGKQAKDGSKVESDGRSTQIYTKAGDRWQLVHEHYSSPVVTP